MDEVMFHHIMGNDDYHLPEKFAADDIILDIGVHIGTFSYKALLRGSQQVYGFEANRSNYECAVHNLRSFGCNAHLYPRAVWRSDDKTVDTLYYSPSLDAANTGGGNVVWGNDGPAVKTIALDDVIRDVTRNGRGRIRMIKIDCEGSEFTILMTSKLLHLVREISGEFHEFCGQYDHNPIPERARVGDLTRFTIVELTEFLQREGFSVTSERHPNTNLGLFHAVNQRSVPRPAFLKVRSRIRGAWQGLKSKLASS